MDVVHTVFIVRVINMHLLSPYSKLLKRIPPLLSDEVLNFKI